MADFDVQSKITIGSKEAQESVSKLISALEDLTTTLKGADKAIEETESALDSATESVNKFEEASKSISAVGERFKQVGASIKEVGKSMTLYLTTPLVGFAALALKEFSNTQREIGKLNNALASSGRYSKEASKQMTEFAEALSKVSTFSGGTVTNSLALATVFTRTNTEAQKLVSAASELATFMGVDLDTAVRQLGQTMNGQAGRLGQMVRGVNQLTEAELKAGAAIELVQRQFSGQALAATQTLGGQITILKNEFNDLAAVIGKDIAPYFQSLVKFIRELIADFNSLDASTRRTIVLFGAIAAAIGPLTVGLGILVSSVGSIISGFGAFVSFIPVILDGFKAMVAFLSGPGGIAIALVSIAALIAGLGNVFLKLKEAGVGTFDALKMSGKLAVTFIADKVYRPILTFVGSILDVLGNLKGAGDTFLGRSVQGAAEQIGKLTVEIEKQFDNAKGSVDKKLAEIGSSAANAFTFGFIDVVKETGDKLKPALDEISIKNLVPPTIKAELSDFEKQVIQTAHNIKMSISNDLAGAFLDFAEGTKSASEAFKQFARNTIRQLTQMILQAMIFRALFPAGGRADGAVQGAARLGSIPAPTFGQSRKYAQGGHVSGPGTGTSDSILARLSNGEFVMKASAVKQLGVGFLSSLNNIRKGPSVKSGGIVPAFANGGLVTSGGPSIVIQNSGTEKTSTRTEYNPETAVTTIVLEDLNKNGPISKSIQQTFGNKRGGFR